MATPTARPRLDAVDWLRGLVMVLMALDHTRDFFSGARVDPLDVARTTPALFFTRWVTHFCAPVFVLLAGAGARLSRRPDLPRFLLTRGLWLVLLELTVVRLGWFFNLDYSLAVGQVIWAIGWAMVALAALVRLPPAAVAVAGVTIIAGHNLLDGREPAGVLWAILHTGRPIALPPGITFVPAYPLLPWIGVIAAGYGLGDVLARPPEVRQRCQAAVGVALVAGFVLLRASNLYGDPHPWTPQATPLRTLLSFLDTTKYPPSLLYAMMTLGPALLMLAAADRGLARVLPGLVTYGRVPLFYYVLHIPLIHGLAILAAIAGGGSAAALVANTFLFARPEGYGFGLGVVYAVTAAVVVALYPACRWFGGVKARRRDAWLSYF